MQAARIARLSGIPDSTRDNGLVEPGVEGESRRKFRRFVCSQFEDGHAAAPELPGSSCLCINSNGKILHLVHMNIHIHVYIHAYTYIHRYIHT